jgi:PAS domain S-box-containing protein
MEHLEKCQNLRRINMKGYPMKEKLRILHLEDDRIHIDLARALLAEDGIDCDFAVVATEKDFAAALDTDKFDLVLADFTLPGFDGMMALAMVRERFPDLPFIFLTGTMGEEIAIDAMKCGATDYVLKNRLSRLAPAVKRALAEVGERFGRKKTEEALRRSNEKLRQSNEMSRALIQASPLAIFLLDKDSRVQVWNPAAERIFGWSAGDVLGKPLPIVPSDQEEEFSRTCTWILQGQLMIRKELQLESKDGVTIDISLHSAPVSNSMGKAPSILAMCADITERKRIDRQLLRSEQKFRTAFEDAAVGMCLTGIDHRFLVVNRSLCNMLGYTMEELLTMNWIETTLPEDLEKCLKWEAGQVAGEGHSASMEQRYLHKDGRIVWGMVSKVLLRDDAGAPSYFINQLQDITELKCLELKLHHSQKMEALGTLTGGIAHDFNNVLTAIIGYGSLLEMKLDESDPSRQFVEYILTAADRAASLTQSLLTFGRKQDLETHVVNLSDIVQGVEKFLLRLLREDIELRTTISDEVCMVLADAGQIEQVLMNLATNARDAMQNGGKLAIATSMIDIGRDFVATHGYGTPGRYALLTVTDTGNGMNEETKSRIFEPFFTTKEVGRGTGLGLSMAYGIVKSHNGYITCYSEPGEGTTFRVYLPAVDAMAEPLSESSAETPPGGTETILVAEDDEQVRILTHKLLESFGYTVIEARDGKDALAQFFAHQETIQLALLDVIMPGKNGREAYEEMRKMSPGLKVLFTSGYSADIFQQGEFHESSYALISKPVLPAELLQKIRHLLDE